MDSKVISVSDLVNDEIVEETKTKKCANCGKPYTPIETTSMFCSIDCKRR
jgi:hypothetical protein